MMDFPNIPEILDFLLANLGIPNKSMISGRFPHAKPSENRNFSPRNFSSTIFSGKSFSGKSFSGEMSLGGKGFRSVRISQICSGFEISGIV